VARNVSQKRALELGLTGDTIDARTALDWGLVNHVVPAEQLDDATVSLLRRATRGSRASKAIGKQTFYGQIGLDQRAAYEHAVDVMARSSQAPDAQEAFTAFLEKRTPRFE
jgi:enoyl-CoA hydratase/carnithine racemase